LISLLFIHIKEYGYMPQSERIKELRKHLGMTQVEFGRKIGIVQGHMTGLETGGKTITAKTFKVICATYGVSEEWLKTGKGQMFAKNPAQKVNRIIGMFDELDSVYQDYMLIQLKKLSTLQKKQIPS